jgi:hypothetical protein
VNCYESLTFSVTNRLDAGPGSLRQALLDANAHPSGQHHFRIPGGGVHRSAREPSADHHRPVLIDGSICRAPPNTLAEGTNAVLQLELTAVSPATPTGW